MKTRYDKTLTVVWGLAFLLAFYKHVFPHISAKVLANVAQHQNCVSLIKCVTEE